MTPARTDYATLDLLFKRGEPPDVSLISPTKLAAGATAHIDTLRSWIESPDARWRRLGLIELGPAVSSNARAVEIVLATLRRSSGAALITPISVLQIAPGVDVVLSAFLEHELFTVRQAALMTLLGRAGLRPGRLLAGAQLVDARSPPEFCKKLFESMVAAHACGDEAVANALVEAGWKDTARSSCEELHATVNLEGHRYLGGPLLSPMAAPQVRDLAIRIAEILDDVRPGQYGQAANPVAQPARPEEPLAKALTRQLKLSGGLGIDWNVHERANVFWSSRDSMQMALNEGRVSEADVGVFERADALMRQTLGKIHLARFPDQGAPGFLVGRLQEGIAGVVYPM